ncbi:MAG: RNA-splicing ligase RtcB [Candidatus Moranbacteria bacterium RBG_13_45_13]|nr:MAG: RNA-splicing ligase RtcB [Candidatus Moranbacteria bacterium RBG_13_45_13]
MIKVIRTEKIPIKLWISQIEPGALEQAKHLANLPFAFHHIAVMPDAHVGYGMPIGGVLAAEGVIIPNAVGVDIGCGMCAAKTTLKDINKDKLKEILGEIRKIIPVGFSHHEKQQNLDAMPELINNLPVVKSQFERARKQVGTLGGGNHFVEIQKGSDGCIWVMVHSGSRNIGKRVADYYNKLAIRLRKKFQSRVPLEWQLDFFPADSGEGRQYFSEMSYCVGFALGNRKLMMGNIAKIFRTKTSGELLLDEMINIAHNYASPEKHFGKEVIVHRKGATQAKRGQVGIIPGSQGSRSFIVRGRGNPESFESCSHGAGRKIGRNEARRTLILEEETRKLNQKGVLHSIRGRRDLDEAPGAYKDIDEVIGNQADLVEVLIKLEPLAVMKG